jgi:Ca2+-transporting ATPase
MDVRSLDASDLPRALSAIVLANDADLTTGAGDPLDLGLLRYAVAHGVDVARLRQEHPILDERPFDSAWKFARVTVREDGRPVSYLKGASEVLLARCVLSGEDRESWTEKGEAYAREGFRVLAVAWAEGETEEPLSLLGLALFWDPPRPEVPEAVRTAQAAGVRIIMMTGDHPATALQPLAAYASRSAANGGALSIGVWLPLSVAACVRSLLSRFMASPANRRAFRWPASLAAPA